NPAVPQGLRLYRTGRDALGLYTLEHAGHKADTSCRSLLEDLWQAVFLFLYNPAQRPLLVGRLERLRTAFPHLAKSVTLGLAGLCASFSRHLRKGAHVLPDDFWRSQPPVIRLFSGYLHMRMQNDGYSSKAWHAALEDLEEITALFMASS
ncbi:glycosyltransferase family 9 protein, partial [Desulfovibrio sp. 1188_IL3213]